MPRKIEISHKTVIFTVFFLLFLWFLYFIKDILLELFVALLLTAILEPLVNTLSKVKIPRGVSVLVSYILFFGAVAGVIALIVPALVEQTASFVASLPGYLSNIGIAEALSEDLVGEFLITIIERHDRSGKFFSGIR